MEEAQDAVDEAKGELFFSKKKVAVLMLRGEE